MVVGAGSSLVTSNQNLEDALGDDILYVSRSLPPWLSPDCWVETKYDPLDNSIESVAKFREISTVVWLASPLNRALFATQSPDEIQASLTQGVLYQSLFVRAILPQMIVARHGRFIFAGSSGAKAGFSGSLVYTQIKSAQTALSRGLAIEYGRLGISSNVIGLGLLESGMASTLPAEVEREMLQRTATGERVKAESFWSLVSFVLENPSMNGAEIPLDGGFH